MYQKRDRIRKLEEKSCVSELWSINRATFVDNDAERSSHCYPNIACFLEMKSIPCRTRGMESLSRMFAHSAGAHLTWQTSLLCIIFHARCREAVRRDQSRATIERGLNQVYCGKLPLAITFSLRLLGGYSEQKMMPFCETSVATGFYEQVALIIMADLSQAKSVDLP